MTTKAVKKAEPIGEEFFLKVLLNIQRIAEELEEYWDINVEDELSDEDAARISLWAKVLRALIEDADESDMVDTLDLHPHEQFVDEPEKKVE